jgi:sugar phosphate isomerase/epimerase
MLLVGLNPYGLAYTLGLQGQGTPRANPKGRGLDGFIEIGREIGARVIELHNPWLAAMSDRDLAALRERIAGYGMTPVISSGLPTDAQEPAIRSAVALGATTIRLALTRVLCGDRATLGGEWTALVGRVREALARNAPRAAGAGLSMAIEDHQDFGSRELLELAEEAGPNVGICFDAGNAFAVGESPVDFARRAAPRICHVHLKDYTPQWTDEGYRLVRCAIGDGAVPFNDVVAILSRHHPSLTASIEPGALEARHIRLFRPDWWNGYAPLTAAELAPCLAAACHRRLPDDADYRTPWERGEDGETLIQYELAMIRRSAANLKALGLM